MLRRLFLGIAACSLYVGAQAPPPRPPSVQASAEAVIQVKPDQARLNIGVVTEAPTAAVAAAQNATQLQSTIDKLRAALGSSGEVKTTGYSLSPTYSYPKDGKPPFITGYTASNTLQVSTTDLGGLGKLIDTVTQAGANRIQGVQFLVKDETPARSQALRQAVQAARANAEAMASGAGLKLGRMLLIEQGMPEVIRPLMAPKALAAGPSTPIEAGTIEVRAGATVTIELQ